jgi:hypothetical protein
VRRALDSGNGANGGREAAQLKLFGHDWLRGGD